NLHRSELLTPWRPQFGFVQQARNLLPRLPCADGLLRQSECAMFLLLGWEDRRQGFEPRGIATEYADVVREPLGCPRAQAGRLHFEPAQELGARHVLDQPVANQLPSATAIIFQAEAALALLLCDQSRGYWLTRSRHD